MYPDLSVIILAYRSEEAIEEICYPMMAELSDEGINYELILVGNYIEGVNDRTPAVVRKLANKYSPVVRAIVEPKLGMMGWDMRRGLESARGSTIAIIDGDGQIPTTDVLKCYQELIQGKFDLVKTRRIKRYDGIYRRFLSKGYNLIFKLVFPNVKSTDINSKPKVFRRQLYNQMTLRADDWFIDSEIMIEAGRLRALIGEIDSVFLENSVRPSFVKFNAVAEFVINLVRYRIHRFFKKI